MASLFHRLPFTAKHVHTLGVMQIVSKLPVGAGRIPIIWEDAKMIKIPEVAFLKEVIFSYDEVYFTKFHALFDLCPLGSLQIDLHHLLETNAMVAELLHLYSAHGVRSTHDYYDNVASKHSDQKYTLLISCFIRLHGDLISALKALYAALAYCLFSSSHPTKSFCELVQKTKNNPSSIYELCNPATIKQAFQNEASVAGRIHKITLMDPGGRVHLKYGADVETTFGRDLVNFNQTIYDCRRKLIDKYVVEYDYNAGLYFEHLYELPIPPVLFLPEFADVNDEFLTGVPEEEFHKRGEPIYVIAGKQRDHASGVVVMAGLTVFAGTESAISLEIADIQLLNFYIYKCLFEGKTTVYSPIVDHMYQQVLRSRPAFKSTK